jgi:hypothetical protein
MRARQIQATQMNQNDVAIYCYFAHDNTPIKW